MGFAGQAQFLWAEMKLQPNAIFNLDLPQKPSSVSWFVVKQIHKSGGEVKTSGYTVKTNKISMLQGQKNPEPTPEQNWI